MSSSTQWKNKYVEVYATDSDLWIVTCMGYNSYVVDPKGKTYRIPMDSSAREIGEKLRQALTEFNDLNLIQAKEMLNPVCVSKFFNEWLLRVKTDIGVSNVNEFWKATENCCLVRTLDAIIIRANKKYKRGRRKSAGKIVLDLDVDDTHIGESLLKGLEICKN